MRQRTIFLLIVSTMLLMSEAAGQPASNAPGAIRSPPAVDAPPSGAGPARRFAIRFLTDSEFPPFHYLDDEGRLTGFDVDLARAICAELVVQCEIRNRAWEDLLPALRKGEADAVIAAQRITPQLVREFELTDRYFHTTARFAGRRNSPQWLITPEGLERRRIGVVKGSPHEAYLRTFFRDSAIDTFARIDEAHEALRQGRVDLVFADSIGLVFWVNGSLSQECCEVKGSAYYEPRFFGDGLSIAVPRSDRDLKILIDEGLARLQRNGRYDELLLRYFPNRVF